HNAAMRYLAPILAIILFVPTFAAASEKWLDELDITQTQQGWGSPQRNKSVDKHPLTVGGKEFERGLGTHAESHLFIRPNEAMRFTAMVGVDDEVKEDRATIVFQVRGDKKVLFDSGVMKHHDPAKLVDIDITGVKKLELRVADAGDGISFDH